MAKIERKRKPPQEHTSLIQRKTKPKEQTSDIRPDEIGCPCPVFHEGPYIKNRKLNPCLRSPLTLYELASDVVNEIPFPEAFNWTVTRVSEWMHEECRFPLYKECIIKNNINGRRLLFLEDPSNLPEINITNFEHIKVITSTIRKRFGMEMILFARSINLPLRKLLTHFKWFKSRTGPTWGIRQLWNSCDLFRGMKIIMPAPIYLDHWDLVWYQKPDFPRVKIARIAKQVIYDPDLDQSGKYLVPRRFILRSGIPKSQQLIWMLRKKKKKEKKISVPKKSETDNEEIILGGLSTKEFLLAKRKSNKPKFFK